MQCETITEIFSIQSYCSSFDVLKKLRRAVIHEDRQMLRRCGQELFELGGLAAMQFGYWTVEPCSDTVMDKIIFEEWGRILLKDNRP